ncbi:hypothetical protein BO85DRAFT_285504 [Aspergillus piperis CBS 112811]|uniref:Uncharacterized protein n=1 Tax=Aspergillus piperis CBS 112811 TaxID=1448313 RepID=A0A8G1R1J4_9EURO|nr:hypothetical protein BO85DRAFT_285504 [Aspergillus piperis CBS 112811]RAH57853.1 hypothetical protein BO85DRAFT_285504 [Aspergillus piperis CBS 112811]
MRHTVCLSVCLNIGIGGLLSRLAALEAPFMLFCCEFISLCLRSHILVVPPSYLYPHLSSPPPFLFSKPHTLGVDGHEAIQTIHLFTCLLLFLVVYPRGPKEHCLDTLVLVLCITTAFCIFSSFDFLLACMLAVFYGLQVCSCVLLG